MSKLTLEDIKPDSILTHTHLLTSEGETSYEIRVCFTLKTGEIIRVTIGFAGYKGQMDFCVRKTSGDYISHLVYRFTPGILKRYLKASFSKYIKDIANKSTYDNSDIIELINKIRKNYEECTPVLKLM